MKRDKKEQTVRVLRKPPAWKVWNPGSRFHLDVIAVVSVLFPLLNLRRNDQHSIEANFFSAIVMLIFTVAVMRGLRDFRTTRFSDFQTNSMGVESVRSARRWRTVSRWTSIVLGFAFIALLDVGVVGHVQHSDSLSNWAYRAALLPAIWLHVRYHTDQHFGLSHWTSLDRASHEIKRVQDAVTTQRDHPDGCRNLSIVTLDHRDLLSRTAAHDFALSDQLVSLGLRPETLEPVPASWWTEVPEGANVAPDDVETDPEIVTANDALIAPIKLLIELGLVRLDAGRLRVTLEGREAMAMPASLAISRLPAHIRAELARADLKFFARDYEGCATLCGTTLESFLKAAIRQLHADHGRRRKLLALHRIDDLDRATLGELSTAMSTYLDVPDGRHSGRSDERRQWLAASGFDPSLLSGFDKDRRQSFAGLLGMCIDLRNEWLHHNPEFRGSHSRQVEDTYRLLHLTRIAISSFCAESGIDPFFVPTRTAAATTEHESGVETPVGDALAARHG